MTNRLETWLPDADGHQMDILAGGVEYVVLIEGLHGG